MQKIQVATTITIDQDGEIRTKTEQKSGMSDVVEKPSTAAGQDEIIEMSEEEAERYAIASDIANVCEYLDDAEVIKIRLIIKKAEARKQREECAT